MSGQSVWIPHNILESENDEEIQGFMMSLYKEAKNIDDSKSLISDISHMSLCSKCSSSLKSEFEILPDTDRRTSGANTPIPFSDPTERKESSENSESSGQLLLIQQTLKSFVNEFSNLREGHESVASAMKRLKVHNLIEDEILMIDKEIQMNMEEFSRSIATETQSDEKEFVHKETQLISDNQDVQTETEKEINSNKTNQTDISGDVIRKSVITEYTDKLLKSSWLNLVELWRLQCPADIILEQLDTICTDSIKADVSLRCICGYRLFKLILELVAALLPKDTTKATKAVALLQKLLEKYPNEAYFFIEASGIQNLSAYLESISLEYRLFYLAVLKLFIMLTKNERVNIFMMTDEFTDRIMLMRKFATKEPEYRGYAKIWPDVYMASLTLMFHILYNEDATPRNENTRMNRDNVIIKWKEMMDVSINYIKNEPSNTESFDKSLQLPDQSTVEEWIKISDPTISLYSGHCILFNYLGRSLSYKELNSLRFQLQIAAPATRFLQPLNAILNCLYSDDFYKIVLM